MWKSINIIGSVSNVVKDWNEVVVLFVKFTPIPKNIYDNSYLERL